MMRWFFVLLIPFVFWASAKTPCIISDFYRLSWINDPTLRHIELSQWLEVNGDLCSSRDLTGIWNNLALWAGTADSGELRAKVLYFYARAVEREGK
jgi:hypothetical protein